MGPVLLLVSIVVLLAGFLIGAAVVAAAWGTWLSADADRRHAGSELIGLNS